MEADKQLSNSNAYKDIAFNEKILQELQEQVTSFSKQLTFYP